MPIGDSSTTHADSDEVLAKQALPPRPARSARIVRNQSVRRALRAVYRSILNPLILRVASGGRMNSVTVIHHHGRHSGQVYATPTGARQLADGFIIPIMFGGQADWVRNVQAAGGCVIEWNGVLYPVVDPEIVDWTIAQAAFSPIERATMRVVGMESFVRLRHA